jgi:hypothetical protein
MEIRGWVKPRGAAEYADVSEEAIRAWMRSGLPYAPVSSRITLIRVSDIDNFIAARLRTRNDVDSQIDDVVSSILNSTKRGHNGRNGTRKTTRLR